MLSSASDFPLQIHWSSASAAPPPGREDYLRAVHLAEQHGLSSVHVPVYGSSAQALEWAAAGLADTSHLSFRVGGDCAALLDGLHGKAVAEAAGVPRERIIVHMLMRDETAPVDERRQLNAANEFVVNLKAQFPPKRAPRLDVEGQSAAAAFLAIQQGDCLWRVPGTAEQTYADALPVLHFGKEVGMTAYVIARETREQAHEDALALLPGPFAEHWQDTKLWRGPNVWSADELSLEGAAAIVGSFGEVAGVLRSFKLCGVTQVMLRELRWGRELHRFAEEVLPRLRQLESKQEAA